MKKLTVVFVALLVLVLTFDLVACNEDKGPGTPAPTITIENLTGSGTEADPYTVSVQNGSQISVTPIISQADLEFAAKAVTGASNVQITIKDGKVNVKGIATGTASVKVNIKDKDTAVFVKVTVTAKPATGIAFSALSEGSGTIAAPYVSTVRAGFALSTPYLVTPSDADDNAVTWAFGTVSDGAFTAADRGITAESNSDNNAVTFTAAKTATVGETYVKATVGSATAYIKLTVTDVSTRTSWTKATFVSDWYTDNCAYNTANTDNLEMPASSFIDTKYAVTAEKSALLVRARTLDADATAVKVYVNGTAISSVIGGTSYAITSDMALNLIYDLSAHIGSTVTVKVENAGANELVLVKAELFAMDTTVSGRTTWEKADIISDWGIKGAGEYRDLDQGFTLNTYDNDSVEYIYNTMDITANTSRLTVKTRMFGNSTDQNANAVLLVNGTAIKAIGYSGIFASVQNVDNKSTYLAYDLSEYVGETVEIAFALANKKVGNLVIQEIKLDTFDSTASELTAWSKAQIISDWDITYAGQYRDRNEGFSLNTFDDHATEFIYNYVPVTADNAKLFVKIRKFGAGNDLDAICNVLANGHLLIPMGYVDGNAIVCNVDGPGLQLVYDLTDYIGQTIQLAIMDATACSGDFVITNLEMSAWEAVTASALDSWTKDTIKSDWNVTYANTNRDVSEGFDMNTYDSNANEFIYNDVTVTAAKTDFVVKVRRFGQDEGRVNACGVLVDGTLLVADGQTAGYVVIADNGDSTILTYDLTEYVGQTVRIVIIQPVPKTGHLVIESIDLQAPVVA